MTTGTKLGLAIAALGLPLTLGMRTAVLDVQSSSTVAAEAFGAYVDALGQSLGETPHAELTAGSVMDTEDALQVEVPGVLAAENLFATTTGAASRYGTSAESNTTLEKVDILDGVVTADGIVALSTSWLDGDRAGSDADGSAFTNLVVAGQAIGSDVAPNTRIDVPGVGTVVLNEHTRHGDGVSSSGLTVNMIRVILKDGPLGVEVGEIVVGSVHSAVTR